MRIRTILFYVAILLIIALCVYLYIYIKGESYDCMLSPLTYGVSKIHSSNGAEVWCECKFAGSQNTLYVTENNMSYQSPFNVLKFNQ